MNISPTFLFCWLCRSLNWHLVWWFHLLHLVSPVPFLDCWLCRSLKLILGVIICWPLVNLNVAAWFVILRFDVLLHSLFYFCFVRVVTHSIFFFFFFFRLRTILLVTCAHVVLSTRFYFVRVVSRDFTLYVLFHTILLCVRNVTSRFYFVRVVTHDFIFVRVVTSRFYFVRVVTLGTHDFKPCTF